MLCDAQARHMMPHRRVQRRICSTSAVHWARMQPPQSSHLHIQQLWVGQAEVGVCEVAVPCGGAPEEQQGRPVRPGVPLGCSKAVRQAVQRAVPWAHQERRLVRATSCEELPGQHAWTDGAHARERAER